MKIAELAERRYTTKAFDPARIIPSEQMDELRALLRNSPSSVNSQPWHFIIAETPEGKDRLTASTRANPRTDSNTSKIRNASHVLVLCARDNLDDTHLTTVLEKEAADGRLATPDAKAAQQKSRSFYVGLHRDEQHDLHAWMDRQVYIALGMVLLGATALGIDSCPIEGFDPGLLDAELDLPARGLRSVVMIALGYRSDEDFNARLPKSRLPAEVVLSRL